MTLAIFAVLLVPAVICFGLLLRLSNEAMILSWALALFALTVIAWMPTLWESDLLGLLSKIAVFLFALGSLLAMGLAFSFATHPRKERSRIDISS